MYLNPQRDLTDLPLKAFYRYALPEFEGKLCCISQEVSSFAGEMVLCILKYKC
jgi:hypothetical protein